MTKELLAEADKKYPALNSTVTRLEDMSPIGKLVLHRQGDGDICMTVVEGDPDGGIDRIAGIEFCTPMSGGGGSHETHKALMDLMLAMERDNDNSNLNSRKVRNG